MLTASTVMIIGNLNVAVMAFLVALPLTAVMLGCVLTMVEIVSDYLKPEFNMPHLAIVNKPADHLKYKQYEAWAMEDTTKAKIDTILKEWMVVEA